MIPEERIMQIHDHVIKPTLEFLGMDSLNARRLMVGTMLVESDSLYIRQIGSGIAKGLFQVEPSTYNDNFNSYLSYRPALQDKFIQLEAQFPSGSKAMQGNMYMATGHARLKYWRAKGAIPSCALGLAKYHKSCYNTAGGATDVSYSVKIFEEVIKLIKE